MVPPSLSRKEKKEKQYYKIHKFITKSMFLFILFEEHLHKLK